MSISEEYRIAAKEWVDLEKSASLLEESKSATLSQMMVAKGDLSVSRAEMLVKASPEWKEYIEQMVSARHKANLAKVKMSWIQMRFGERQSSEATARAEMRM
jgi:hypothetical protein